MLASFREACEPAGRSSAGPDFESAMAPSWTVFARREPIGAWLRPLQAEAKTGFRCAKCGRSSVKARALMAAAIGFPEVWKPQA